MMRPAREVTIGTIVRSESHVRYTCQVYAAGEVAEPPEPADYAFGSFVRIPLRARRTLPDVARLAPPPDARDATIAASDALLGAAAPSPATWAIGLIYDTILLNPAFGTLGPRLSSEAQVAVFSPDYLTERAVLVSILLLGTLEPGSRDGTRAQHGVPPVAPDLGANVTLLDEQDVRRFHAFADAPGGRPYLHMGYLPHAVAQDNPLLPLAMLRTIEHLERLFPENAALLTIVKRNFAWRLKVETAG